MAKYDLKFIDVYLNDLSIKCEINYVDCVDETCINIKIESEDSILDIDLDKSTAIKFAKTLRTEINKITESEVKNER